MTLTNFITEKNIIFNLDVASQREAIQVMAEALYKNGYLKSLNDFVADVLKRENMTTTGIGNNIAIPHGKSAAVKEATVIFAKSKNMLEWNSLDNKPVNIIFLMAVPKGDKGDIHLRFLAQLSGELMNGNFVNSLKNSTTVSEILKILSNKGV